MGEIEQARCRFRDNLVLAREIGRREAIANALAGLAMVNAREERFEPAAELFAAAHALRREVGLAPPPWDQAEEQEQIDGLRSTLDEAAFNLAWTTGGATDIRTIIDHTLRRLSSIETSSRPKPKPSRLL
jgi:hypothetical protein